MINVLVTKKILVLSLKFIYCTSISNRKDNGLKIDAFENKEYNIERKQMLSFAMKVYRNQILFVEEIIIIINDCDSLVVL